MCSCYFALLGSPFPSKSCLRVRSSMKAEPYNGVETIDGLQLKCLIVLFVFLHNLICVNDAH